MAIDVLEIILKTILYKSYIFTAYSWVLITICIFIERIRLLLIVFRYYSPNLFYKFLIPTLRDKAS